MIKKDRPVVGDKSWEVEWCSHIPVDSHGDWDRDNSTICVQFFDTKDEAMVRAKEVLPHDQLGSVCVTPKIFEAYVIKDVERYPHAGFWSDNGEPEYYSVEGSEA